jgi:hypothetical protein
MEPLAGTNIVLQLASRGFGNWRSSSTMRKSPTAHVRTGEAASVSFAGRVFVLRLPGRCADTEAGIASVRRRISGNQPRIVSEIAKPEGRGIKAADSTKLRTVYPGFCTSVGLDDGLRRMLGWYRATFERAA